MQEADAPRLRPEAWSQPEALLLEGGPSGHILGYGLPRVAVSWVGEGGGGSCGHAPQMLDHAGMGCGGWLQVAR